MDASGVRRGDVYLLDPSRHGGELRGSRPVIVVQNDAGNRFAAETIVIAVRDPHGGRMLPVFVALPKGTAGLAKACIADAGHVVTVSKGALRARLGTVPPPLMAQVDAALRTSLGLV